MTVLDRFIVDGKEYIEVDEGYTNVVFWRQEVGPGKTKGFMAFVRPIQPDDYRFGTPREASFRG